MLIGDVTLSEDDEFENKEGAIGTIRIVVDTKAGHYNVIISRLPLGEGTFRIE